MPNSSTKTYSTIHIFLSFTYLHTLLLILSFGSLQLKNVFVALALSTTKISLKFVVVEQSFHHVVHVAKKSNCIINTATYNQLFRGSFKIQLDYSGILFSILHSFNSVSNRYLSSKFKKKTAEMSSQGSNALSKV